MSKQASYIPAVDLVIVIDTSPSMKDEAQSLSDAAASAIAIILLQLTKAIALIKSSFT
ncbi:hypothetical protein [Nostoc sp. CHAB 5715]|uniref:hypothetical protein n=1 Tax=Nostoc sp. CHAB 5715 TaxID=2780400 RepID=UPI001E560E5F|nr:hypothetical protein [Nostoc sp. CHAB 5715]MCC5621557.1 hypothetical protein [Nostoc sp. CHAB 5715]